MSSGINPLKTDLDFENIFAFFHLALKNTGFNVNEFNVDAIDEIVKKTFLSDKLRGFELFGDYDTGKTFFAKRYATIVNSIKDRAAELYTANEVARFFKDEKIIKQDGSEQPLDTFYKTHILIIDDIGTEPPEVQSFGTKLQPISELIQQRYDRNKAIWFTTNIDQDSMKRVYGERITSRLKEMTYSVLFKGKDLYRGK